MNALPHPLTVTDETVTFSRADVDAFLDRLEELEDRATVVASMAARARLGDAEYERLCYTAAELDQRLAGVSRLAIWRARTPMTQRQLAEAVGVSASYVANIERGLKTGSAGVLARIAKTLNIPLGHLLEDD